MSFTITIPSFKVSEKDKKVIKDMKYRYIQHISWFGVTYRACGFVSGYLNEMIDRLNTDEPLVNNENDFPVWSSDFEHLRSQGDRFIREVEEKISDKEVVPYLKSFLDDVINLLEKLTDKARIEREAKELEEGTSE